MFNYRDAIVNPANTKLNHGAGAAKAIADAAGDEFKQECIEFISSNNELQTGKAMMTSAGGTLQCENVIHTVGPIYKKKQAEHTMEFHQLCDAVRSVLEIVDKKKMTSVSIPAISTGIYDFPVKECCRLIGKTIRNYIAENPQSMEGKKIIICNFDDETTKFFKDNFKNAVTNESYYEGDEEDDEEKSNENNDDY
jgi:O-acetyl-ADP-ribose deacetylase (regulator of RNase III)